MKDILFPFPWWVVLILALLGILFMLKGHNLKALLITLFTLSLTLITPVLYQQLTPIEFWHLGDYQLSSVWIEAFICSLGFGYLVYCLTLLLVRLKRPSALFVNLIIFLLTLTSVLIFITENYSANNQTDEVLYYNYGLEALRSLDQNAVYFAETDYDFFSTDYLRNVEGKRLDSFVFLTPLFRYPYEFHEALFNLHLPANHPETHSPFDSISKVNTLASRPLFLHLFQRSVRGYIFNSFNPLPILPHAESCYIGLINEKKNPTKIFVKELNEFWDKNLASLSNHPDPSILLLLEACAHPYLNTASFLKAEGNLTSWDLFYVRALKFGLRKIPLQKTWDNKSEGDTCWVKKEKF